MQFFEKACHRDDLKKRATLKDVYLREVFEVGIGQFKTTIQDNNSKNVRKTKMSKMYEKQKCQKCKKIPKKLDGFDFGV